MLRETSGERFLFIGECVIFVNLFTWTFHVIIDQNNGS